MNKRALLVVTALTFGATALATGTPEPMPTCKNMGFERSGGQAQMKVPAKNAIGKDICIAEPAAENRQARTSR